MATPEGENPFWTFSLSLYDRPRVAESCLALQEARGLDVNLLLFALWAASQGRSLDRADLARLLGQSAAWHVEVVRPLRAVRRRLKEGGAGAETLRGQVKEAELLAERLEQDLLQAALPLQASSASKGPDRKTAEANLAACLALYGGAVTASERKHLKPLLAALVSSRALKARRRAGAGT